MPFSSDIFSKILLVCQAFRYSRTEDAALEIDTKSAVGIYFKRLKCHNLFGGYEDFIEHLHWRVVIKRLLVQQSYDMKSFNGF